MKLYRVLDENSQIIYAADAGDETLRRVEGDIFGEYSVTDRPVRAETILAPLTPPAIFAVGGNYRSHIEEVGASIPETPVVFAKAITSVIGPDNEIILPACGPDHVDYEVELAVIIGQTCRDVPAADAGEFILGYTVANDVSARDWQKQIHQWVRAKSFDTFCPLGPCIATDVDPSDLHLRTTLNGNVMQDATTDELIFSVPQLVEFISSDLTLLAGTVILTGTPGGVGEARSPQVYLRPGDTIACTIDGIGELTNTVKERD
ncbi:MAG: fumarylacetoacetate hydrolase family protein [Planctomycetota bacterium]|nr:fumarylacetoacetate hydrolase family protein [Planctomycetota bacterium]